MAWKPNYFNPIWLYLVFGRIVYAHCYYQNIVARTNKCISKTTSETFNSPGMRKIQMRKNRVSHNKSS